MKTKEEFIKEQLNVDKLTPLQWSGILRAMDNYADQQVKNLNMPGVSDSLLERAASLVGNPGTNISGSTDLACEEWQKDYERWRNDR